MQDILISGKRVALLSKDRSRGSGSKDQLLGKLMHESTLTAQAV